MPIKDKIKIIMLPWISIATILVCILLLLLLVRNLSDFSTVDNTKITKLNERIQNLEKLYKSTINSSGHVKKYNMKQLADKNIFVVELNKIIDKYATHVDGVTVEKHSKNLDGFLYNEAMNSNASPKLETLNISLSFTSGYIELTSIIKSLSSLGVLVFFDKFQFKMLHYPQATIKIHLIVPVQQQSQG